MDEPLDQTPRHHADCAQLTRREFCCGTPEEWEQEWVPAAMPGDRVSQFPVTDAGAISLSPTNSLITHILQGLYGRIALVEMRPGDSFNPACWAWPIPPLNVAQLDNVSWITVATCLVSYRFDVFHGGPGNLHCAICGTDGRMVKDHDHVDRMFRGYLCPNCNRREGVEDTPEIVEYRQRPPSVILGEFVGYDDEPPCPGTLRRPGYERHHERFGHLLGSA